MMAWASLPRSTALFDPPKELLNAIGRGVEPLVQSVRAAARPVIAIDRLPRPDPTKRHTRPRAAFSRSESLSIDEMPHFFGMRAKSTSRDQCGRCPGSRGISGFTASMDRRGCAAFACSMHICRSLACPTKRCRSRDPRRSSAQRDRCCPQEDCAPALVTKRARLPITRRGGPGLSTGTRSIPGGLSCDQLELSMRNRALTGPEKARQYRAYTEARAAAIEVLAPFYRDAFGRTPAEAKRLGQPLPRPQDFRRFRA